jgi:phospholipid/cholesterol/gamma-HCH transport system substrate-binding protein
MSPAAKIGLFMMIALVILGAFIIKIQDIPIGERGERLLVNVRLPSAVGIDKKAAVRIAGVRVGKVEAVHLAGAEAELVLSLEPDVTLHRGATARVASMGMLGEKYVELSPGPSSEPALASGAEIQGTVPPTFDDVMKVATQVGGDVKQVTEALRESMGGQQGAQKIDQIMENVRQLTADLKTLVAENQANVNATTANFREFSASLRDELPKIADRLVRLSDQLNEVVAANRENVTASLENVRDLSGRLRTTADNLNEITGKIASGEGTIGKLVNDDETVDNLNKTLDDVSAGVQTLNESLGRAGRWKLDMKAETTELASVSETRSTFGFDLWTTDRRFYRIDGVDTPFGVSRTKTQTVTTLYPDGSQDSRTTTTTTVENKIAFNAQIGYRVLPDTIVRAGLFESKGGVGIDYEVPLSERRPLVLSLNAYDFNREDNQDLHLRFEGRYFLTPHLFLTAGWDDPMVSESSSVLIGGGVTWRDEDVKYSLGLAGSAAH